MVAKALARFQVRHLYPIFPIALAAVLAARSITDNSFLWHVRAGSEQLAASRVLATDPFSYVTAGEAWRTQSWLVELLYAFAESTFGGVGWASLMVALIITGTMIFMGIVAYANVHSTFSTGVWLLVLTWLLWPFSMPRPVVFSYLLLAMLVVTLALGDRALWIVVPIIWMWAGIHGSWILGLGLVTLVAISQRSVRVAGVGTFAAMATAATAHGFGAWSVVYLFAQSASVLDYMQEWKAPDFGDIVQFPYLIVLVGLLIGAVKGKIAMSDLWVVLPFMILGFMSRRMVPVAALVLLPFAARSVRVAVPTSARVLSAFPWVVLSTVLAAVTVVHLLPRDTFDMERFPSEAVVAAAGSGRFFHDDAVGGYLIYRDGPERLVYIDDRAELYGEERFAEFLAARDGSYEALFDRLGFDAALVRPSWALRTALLRDGWHVTYSDRVFEVLEPGGH